MKRISLFLLLTLARLACADVFEVLDIRVEGLQRVSAGTVFSAVSLNVGDTADEISIRQVIRELFKTGFFLDVKVGRDGDILVISVSERPSISDLQIEGNKAIETEALLEGLKQSGLESGQIFKQSTLEHIRQDLERQYVAQGRYGAKIETTVEELQRNRIQLQIDVTEGEVAGIRHINIVGNTLFSDEQLGEVLELKLPSLFSFYTKDDKYSKEKLSGDLESLESYYLDRGYVNFSIESTQVSITPDKRDVYITINIVEGDRFSVGDVEIAGELHEVPEGSIYSLLVVRKGQVFSRARMTASEERIETALGNAGYTFASATGEPVPNGKDSTLTVKFFVDAGRRAYVRRINFSGNTVTQDTVLRREMRQMEGGWASTASIERSKVRMERLGFFKAVNVETPPVPGTDDQIDVEYSVEEQPSGSISATLGYAQGTGLILGLGYQETNIFGSGNSVNVGVNRSDFQTAYNFSFFDPYYTVDGVSRGYSMFFRQSDYGDFNIATFSSDSFGGAVNYGYPISELSRINFSVGYENTHIKEGLFPAQEISEFVGNEGSYFDLVSVTGAYQMSALNRGLLPSGGRSQSVSLEMTLPGSSLEFFQLRYTGQIFFPLTRLFTLRLRTDLGFGSSYGKTKTYPFYKHFYSGGMGSVRGYEQNTLGPKSTPSEFNILREPDPIGGNVLIEGSAEILFPLPFVKDRRSLKSVLFVDAGNVFNTNCPQVSTFCKDFDYRALRYSAGIAVTWITGFAPISFSLSVPFNDLRGDDTEAFQFELGRTF
ncbi:MAG: outer membrane protein assembly factor BamA [Pseudomonadales bacterium]|nr:outer membrane protein assembly factor BamA [Pseudomonadales bacterium]MDP7357746.1 outer membrane protein assembly factor BamA [Pseudomonadales bacterium]MDP7596191.1 outer membrane protein assembly factor BamA [Pseudomonadales bacterium]HJN50449.1 outer membrane protein assembly factor BamA [Pseudomonadales bacterium]